MFGRSETSDDVAATEALSLQQRGAVLLDVREDDEWLAGHAPGAVHVPLSDVAASTARFADVQVLTVCRGGARAARAAEQLAAVRIEVRNVSGGMVGWQTAGLPVVRDDGSPGATS